MKAYQFVLKELREALPATVFFLVLFHLLMLTKTVVLAEYSIDALRATSATLCALIVAKSILLIEALPIARWFSRAGWQSILWKTCLFGVVVLLFRFVEELLHVLHDHSSVASAVRTLLDQVYTPIFWLSVVWTYAGLLLYSVLMLLAEAMGPKQLHRLFFGAPA